MRGVAELAAKYQLPIQSHISENRDEVAWVKSLHPSCQSYADVYDQFGLLTDKTIMAHAVYLTKEERDLFVSKGVGIAHCPLSNMALNSGFMCVRDMLGSGIKVGLGTDVSGGYSPSILSSIRTSLIASTVHHVSGGIKPLTWQEGFFLATVGGSRVIGCGDKLGNFLVGKEFDAIVVDPYCEDSPFDVFHETVLEIVEKFIYLGDDRNIVNVYVKGSEVI
eukprot:TRINITY_DN4984_c0_g1_i7.p1 TRINITY_DN4984_c0_g1~~TRINITY_DN4984_c0_g1_i7.p1  ORF type:complete len:221 (-),score=43.51 TRINITY_DN4984_c0_g1_i7:26-688(-)